MRHLLIIDRDLAYAKILGQALRCYGYSVTVLVDTAQVAKHLDRLPVDCVVLDSRLMEEVLGTVGRQRTGRRPILVLGAHGHPRLAASAIRNGAVDFLTKPINASLLNYYILQHVSSIHEALPIRLLAPRDVRAFHAIEVWERTDRNMTKTRQLLGISRQALRRILKQYDLSENVKPSNLKPTPENRHERLSAYWTGLLSKEQVT